MTLAYVGLGSNLDRPLEQVDKALIELATIRDSKVTATSSLYRSSPMGPQDQPDFINAVAQLETELEPLVLLDALLEIESRHNRQRTQHWGARTLDLDLLLYADLQMLTERLTLPHPGVHQRDFVLVPLLEIAPQIEIPGIGKAADQKPVNHKLELIQR